MAFPAYVSRAYSGQAQATTLKASMSATDLTFTLVNTSSWVEIGSDASGAHGHSTGSPMGTSGVFVVAVDFGTGTEEKILCSTVDTVGGTVTVWTDSSGNNGRGYDGTNAIAHAAGSNNPIIPVFSAIEADEANDAAVLVSNFRTAGDLLVGTGTYAAGRLAYPSSPANQVLTATNTGIAWSAAANPSGVIMDFAGSTAPAGYLLCDGTAYSRTTYATLFAAIGTTWGSGDGSTTFNVPNLLGRTTVGAGTPGANNDTTFGATVGSTSLILGKTSGEQQHLLLSTESGNPALTTGGQSADHTHNLPGVTTFTLGPGGALALMTAQYYGASGNSATSGTSNNHTHSITANNAANGHNNMMPYGVVNKIIKY